MNTQQVRGNRPGVSHLELVRLQLAFPGPGGQRGDVGADGRQPFGVCVEHDGRDEAAGRAHSHAQVHHVIPESIRRDQYQYKGSYKGSHKETNFHVCA